MKITSLLKRTPTACYLNDGSWISPTFFLDYYICTFAVVCLLSHFFYLTRRCIFFNSAFFRPYFSQASNFGDYSLSYGCNGECTTDLFIQFLILFIGDMGYTSFNSNIMPIAVHLSRRNKRNSVEPLNEEHLEADERGNIKSSSVPQFVIDDKLQSLASNNERELEYLSVTIQYGLISSFSIIFPLAP